MAKLFLTSINLNDNELLNVVLHNLTTLPSDAPEGKIGYFDDYIRYKGKTQWEALAKKSAVDLKLDKSVFDDLFEKVDLGGGHYAIKAKYDFYSTGGVSAYGFGDGGGGGGGGSSFDRLDAWGVYDSTKAGWVLSALLGYDLHSRLASLESGSASYYDIIGTGNAITDVSKSGNTFTFNRGVTFATLDANGKVPASQLPSYVDDVLEYAGVSNFPTTGEAGKIYVDTVTNKTYRWGGTTYVEISGSLALGITSSTAFRGDFGKIAHDHAQAKGNAYASGLYKITTNSEGHVTGATAVVKTDITALGIPGQDTVYTHPTGDGNLHVPATGTSNNGKFLKAGTTAGSLSWVSLTISDITGVADGLARKKTGTFTTSATSYTIAHTLGNKHLIAQVKRISDGEVVECDIKINATNIVFTFNAALAANAYEYTIIG